MARRGWVAALTALIAACGAPPATKVSPRATMPAPAAQPERRPPRPEPARIRLTAIDSCHDGVGLKLRFAVENLAEAPAVASPSFVELTGYRFTAGARAGAKFVTTHDDTRPPAPVEPCGVRDGWLWQHGQRIIETIRLGNAPRAGPVTLAVRVFTRSADCTDNPAFEGEVAFVAGGERCPEHARFDCWNLDYPWTAVLHANVFDLGSSIELTVINCGSEAIALPTFEGWRTRVCLLGEPGKTSCEQNALEVEPQCARDLVRIASGEQASIEVAVRKRVPRVRHAFRPGAWRLELLAPLYSPSCDLVGWVWRRFERGLSAREATELSR